MTKISVKHRYLYLFAVIALSGVLSGCATIDYEVARTATYASSPESTLDTHFGRFASGETKGKPEGYSGFRLLNDGVEAFAARLLMTEHAEQTIDAQYYLIKNDLIGFAYANALLRAADRGVKVRFLLDDFLTGGLDKGIVALDTHPNIEVRIYNPFANRGFRPLDLPNAAKLNRRMHNKAMIADNQLTLIGGRNIAGEYFGARSDLNFGDLDVIAVGPIVQETSEMFDLYWNSWAAFPPETFIRSSPVSKDSLEKLRERIDEVLADAENTVYADALLQDYAMLSGDQVDDIYWHDYKLLYDSPDKTRTDKSLNAPSISTEIHEAIRRAKNEFLLISPYFVPLKEGEEFFKKLVERGVKVTVITNSLSANNHTAVHSGYVASRKKLLAMGVALYEVKANITNPAYTRVGNEEARTTLHTKAFIIDRKELFIGSFNWDPRSINLNTEMGVIIDSAILGEGITEAVNTVLQEKTYEIALINNQVRWLDKATKPHIIHSREPDTSWWKRFSVAFMRLLPIKSQL